jgi:16S rRNA (guanine527-N7)-methyltransferase
VKRPRPGERPDALAVSRETASEKIAGETRERVARWLGETTLHPRAGFLNRIEKMAAALALWGAHTNLTADASDPVEIAFHTIDSLAPIAFAPGSARDSLDAALGASAKVMDLGSGGGFPSLVLAAAFEAQFTLVEARRKRASYLQVAAHEMVLTNVVVEQRRASSGTIAGGFDLVTARAFGTSELFEIAAAALGPGGFLLQYAGADEVGEPQALANSFFADRTSWTYRLPHGERVANRTGVLWRRKADL